MTPGPADAQLAGLALRLGAAVRIDDTFAVVGTDLADGVGIGSIGVDAAATSYQVQTLVSVGPNRLK